MACRGVRVVRRAAHRYFDRRPSRANWPRPLDARIGPWIAQVGTGLREWIEAIVDDPQCRVIGAKRAAKWFQSYLKRARR